MTKRMVCFWPSISFCFLSKIQNMKVIRSIGVLKVFFKVLYPHPLSKVELLLEISWCGGYHYCIASFNKVWSQGTRWILFHNKVLKRLVYLGYWKIKQRKMFSMRVRNKRKHKFAATKICKTVEGKRILES